MQKPGIKNLLGCGTIFDNQQAECNNYQVDFYLYEEDYPEEMYGGDYPEGMYEEGY